MVQFLGIRAAPYFEYRSSYLILELFKLLVYWAIRMFFLYEIYFLELLNLAKKDPLTSEF